MTTITGMINSVLPRLNSGVRPDLIKTTSKMKRISIDGNKNLTHLPTLNSSVSRKSFLIQDIRSTDFTDREEQVVLVPSSEALFADSRLKDVFKWEFNITQFRDINTLCLILGQLFEAMFDFQELNISRVTFGVFIQEMSIQYHEQNPFHNFHHACTVTHVLYKLFEETKATLYVSKMQLFATMIAAIGHDTDHPGNTNIFEINSESERALIYNDISVLENHHAATLFRILRKKNVNIFQDFSPADFKDIKKTIILCILSTDMTKHFSQVAEINTKITSKWELPRYSGVGMSEDSLFYCKLMVHAADLSNACRPFEIAKYWGYKIAEEFNAQVEKEEKLGLPVLNFMIARNNKQICENEIGFSTNVVAPMWHSIAVLWPELSHLETQMQKNYLLWRELLDQNIVKPTKKAIKLI